MSDTRDLRRAARALFDAAVLRADPGAALTRHLSHAPMPSPDGSGTTILIAIGKAAPAMMSAALSHVTGTHRALCITHHDNPAPCPGATLMHGGHPVPDAGSLAAGRAVLDLLDGLGAEDRVIALISGGGSALVCAPAAGLGLDDKIALNRALLASGLDIVQMNMIRQQASRLKGGGFLRAAAPAPVTGYVLSDVIGDDLNAIASGPTTAPIGTRTAAMRALKEAQAWDALGEPLRAHFEAAGADTAAAEENPPPENALIGSNTQSLGAAAGLAEEQFATRIVSDRLTGDVGDAARAIHAAACALPPDAPATALLWGGETTVRLTGKGRGGRNQQMALQLAALDQGADAARPDPARRWLFLSGGTDGRDGPTDAAGGMVDAGTWRRICDAGGDPAALLADNDSHTALKLAGDLLITGATGTNVADIQILLSVPASGPMGTQ